MIVYDTSFHRPAPSKLPAGAGVIVYCSRDGAKVPSVDEVAAYRRAAHPVGFVFEDQAERAVVNNYATGLGDARLAASQAAARGHEYGKPIYCACDTGFEISIPYLQGWIDGLHPHYIPGLYAGDRNLEIALQYGVRRLWQAGAGSWSDHYNSAHGIYYGRADLVQLLDTDISGTDRNLVVNPAWNDPIQSKPTVPPAGAKEESDMVLWLNNDNGGKTAFWLSGGKAVTSNENDPSRQTFIANGGLVVKAGADEFSRILKAFS